MVKLLFIKWFMILFILVVKIQSTFDNLHAYPIVIIYFYLKHVQFGWI